MKKISLLSTIIIATLTNCNINNTQELPETQTIKSSTYDGISNPNQLYISSSSSSIKITYYSSSNKQQITPDIQSLLSDNNTINPTLFPFACTISGFKFQCPPEHDSIHFWAYGDNIYKLQNKCTYAGYQIPLELENASEFIKNEFKITWCYLDSLKTFIFENKYYGIMASIQFYVGGKEKILLDFNKPTQFVIPDDQINQGLETFNKNLTHTEQLSNLYIQLYINVLKYNRFELLGSGYRYSSPEKFDELYDQNSTPMYVMSTLSFTRNDIISFKYIYIYTKYIDGIRYPIIPAYGENIFAIKLHTYWFDYVNKLYKVSKTIK